MKYATGKFARGSCQRCSFVYPYQEIRTEWNGSRVCVYCYEAKHPQLGPFPVGEEAIALEKPARRENDPSNTDTTYPPFPDTHLYP